MLSYGPGKGGSFKVSVAYRLAPWGMSRRNTTAIEVNVIHNVFVDKVVLTFKAIAVKALPPFPRVGVRMRCTGAFKTVEWYGRGPHECYPDRKSSAPYGRYLSSIHDMHTPYIVPSENGGRADVNWVALSNLEATPILLKCQERQTQVDMPILNSQDRNYTEISKAPRLLVAMPPGKNAQISVQRHALESLDAASHTHRLEELTDSGDGTLHLHVDHLHMGLGGDDSWTPSVHPNFIIPPGNEWNWSFTLAPTQSDCDVRVLHNELHAIS